MDRKQLLCMTADIVSAHASSTSLTQEQLLAEINNVFAKLSGLQGDYVSMEVIPAVAAAVEVADAPLKPALPMAAAFGSSRIFCMICGAGMKTLKRHLSSTHNMKPGAYRKAFGIPAGTALVAKEYSEKRKEMAKSLNLAERLVKARAVRKSNKTKAVTPKKAALKVKKASKAKKATPT